MIKGGLDTSNQKNDINQIPIMGDIAAGTPIEAIQNEVSTVILPEALSKNEKREINRAEIKEGLCIDISEQDIRNN